MEETKDAVVSLTPAGDGNKPAERSAPKVSEAKEEEREPTSVICNRRGDRIAFVFRVSKRENRTKAVMTPSGPRRVEPGDIVVAAVSGDLTVCSEDHFHRKHRVFVESNESIVIEDEKVAE